MSIEKNLLEGEEIIYRTKKHYIIFFVPLVWVLGTIAFLLTPNSLVVKAAIAPAIAAVFTGVNQWLEYITARFVVTNKRVMMKEGFFNRHANELRLATVSNMTVDQSLLGQILGYGAVTINPFGGNSDVFNDIANPFEFQKQTQAQLDKLVK